MIFLNLTPKAIAPKAKLNKWDYIKLKGSCIAKGTINKWKVNLLNGRKISANHISDKGLTSKIGKNSNNSTAKKHKNLIKKWAKDLNRYFPKEDTQMANHYIERCSTSLTKRKMQIKSTMRYHLTSIRTAIIKRKSRNKCWQGCGEKRILVHYW